jgi:hypothetical protein
MPSNALTRNAINSTLSTLKNGNAESVAPRDGVPLIDDWLKALENAPQASSVLNQLIQLRSLLQMPQPDPDQLKMVLNNLADNTTQIAQGHEGAWINELEDLTVALRSFSTQL